MANEVIGAQEGQQMPQQGQETPAGEKSTYDRLQNLDQETVDANTQRDIDTFSSLVMKLMHGKETRSEVINMLKSAPPDQTIPATAVKLVMEADGIVSKNKEMSTEGKIAGLIYAVMDLSQMTNAMGLTQYQEKDLQPIFHSAFQQVIESGLADGSIDPIELQAMTEEILPPQMKQLGMSMAKELGLPEKPDEKMAYKRVTDQKVRPLQQENESLKKQLSALKPPAQGQQQGGPQQAPPGFAGMFPQGGK